MVNLNNVGNIYRTQDRFPEALKYYEDALKIAIQIGDINARGLILNNSGTIYVSQTNYTEAMKRYDEALKISKQLGDRSLNSSCLLNIGNLKRIQGNTQEGLLQSFCLKFLFAPGFRPVLPASVRARRLAVALLLAGSSSLIVLELARRP